MPSHEDEMREKGYCLPLDNCDCYKGSEDAKKQAARKFKRGDYVDRKSGSYRFPGVVLSVYDNMGTTMCDVRLAGFRMIHIFNASHLKWITKEEFERVDDAVLEVLSGNG